MVSESFVRSKTGGPFDLLLLKCRVWVIIKRCWPLPVFSLIHPVGTEDPNPCPGSYTLWLLGICGGIHETDLSKKMEGSEEKGSVSPDGLASLVDATSSTGRYPVQFTSGTEEAGVLAHPKMTLTLAMLLG